MSEDYEKEFCVLLTSLRVKRQEQRRWGMKWNQGAVAMRIGVSRGMYNQWENGLAVPSRRHLQKIVSTFYLDEEEETKLYRAAAQVPPEIDNLPSQRNPFFTGREEHLEQLRKQLQETGTVAITQSAISGLGGIGKTQLALEYAHRHYKKVYRAALWVNAAGKETFHASYASLIKTLKLEEQHEQDLYRRIEAVKDWLGTHTKWLLIIDNADDLPLALSLLPSRPLGHVIFTTRSQIVRDSNIAAQIKVEEMKPVEGLLLLLRRSGVIEAEAQLATVAEDILDTAHDVVELLGRLPLALDQAGAYIEQTGVSFTDYIQRFHKKRLLLLSKRRLKASGSSEHPDDSQHPESVVATFDLCFQEARKRHPLAQDILYFCAFLQPDAIPEELFQYDDSFKPDPIEFDEGIAALQRYSLIKRNTQEKTLSVHRLVQAVVMDEMPADIKKQWRARVLRAMRSLIPLASEEGGLPTDLYYLLLPHALICTNWEEDGSAFMLDVSYLCLTVAVIGRVERFRKQELFLELLERSLAIRERYLGTDHPDTLHSLCVLAYYHWRMSNYEQAELLCEGALPNYERCWGWGLQYPHTDMCFDLLVSCYCEQGKYEQAVLVWQRVLEDLEKRLGTECFEVANALHHLARLYAAIPGKLAESESLYQRAMAILEKLQIAVNTGEIRQLVSLALREQHSGELTIAIHNKIRKEISEDQGILFDWCVWPELEPLYIEDPDRDKRRELEECHELYLRNKARDAESAALAMNDEPSV